MKFREGLVIKYVEVEGELIVDVNVKGLGFGYKGTYDSKGIHGTTDKDNDKKYIVPSKFLDEYKVISEKQDDNGDGIVEIDKL